MSLLRTGALFSVIVSVSFPRSKMTCMAYLYVTSIIIVIPIELGHVPFQQSKSQYNRGDIQVSAATCGHEGDFDVG
jgi:hypothetical protein